MLVRRLWLANCAGAWFGAILLPTMALGQEATSATPLANPATAQELPKVVIIGTAPLRARPAA